jgi:hypothetical protein
LADFSRQRFRRSTPEQLARQDQQLRPNLPGDVSQFDCRHVEGGTLLLPPGRVVLKICLGVSVRRFLRGRVDDSERHGTTAHHDELGLHGRRKLARIGLNGH